MSKEPTPERPDGETPCADPKEAKRRQRALELIAQKRKQQEQGWFTQAYEKQKEWAKANEAWLQESSTCQPSKLDESQEGFLRTVPLDGITSPLPASRADQS
eukprot:gene2954-578_t